MGQTIKVRVPGTSANLGPGFDCLGIALSCYNAYSFLEQKEGLSFLGYPSIYQNENNLVYKAMNKVFSAAGKRPGGIFLGLDADDIPASRGLGSSAACIVAGMVGANALIGSPFSHEDLFQMASQMEGHPDNIAPAFFGGMTVSFSEDDCYTTKKVPVAEGLSFMALIPDFPLSTEKARAILPKSLSYADVIYNIGRAAMLPLCLMEGDFAHLSLCLGDRLHQPYRASLIKGYHQIREEAKKGGAYGTYLSGAGPTMMSLVPKEKEASWTRHMATFFQTWTEKWRICPLAVDNTGVSLHVES